MRLSLYLFYYYFKQHLTLQLLLIRNYVAQPGLELASDHFYLSLFSARIIGMDLQAWLRWRL